MRQRDANIARLEAEAYQAAPGQHYVLDRFKPEDAWGVARLYHAVYGPDYAVDTPYVPEALIAANANGDIITLVARADSGDILGQTAFYKSSPPNPRFYEGGQVLVLPAYRNTAVAFKLLHFFMKTLPSVDLDGLFVEVVTNHAVTQKMSLRIGLLETGFEAALLPEEAYAREGAVGRMSCLLYALVQHDPGGTIFVPERYAEELAFCREGLGLTRELAASRAPLPSAGVTRLKKEWFEFAGVARLHLLETGADLPMILDTAESSSPAVVQVYVNLAEPCCGAVVELLAGRGYFFGGYLPLWLGPDALMLQKLTVTPTFEGLALDNDRGRAVVEMVRRDWERSRETA